MNLSIYKQYKYKQYKKSKHIFTTLGLLVLFILIPALVFSSTFVLKDGTILVGSIVSIDEEYVVIAITPDSTINVPKDAIEYMDKGDGTRIRIQDFKKNGIVLRANLPMEGSEEVHYQGPIHNSPSEASEETESANQEQETEADSEEPNYTNTRKIFPEYLKISMKKRFALSGAIAAPRIDAVLIGFGVYGEYWFNEFISTMVGFRLSLYERTNVQTDASIRFHLTGPVGTYRPYIGAIMGLCPVANRDFVGRFHFGFGTSVANFTAKNMIFDIGYTGIMFVFVQDSVHYKYDIGFTIDILRIGYIF